MRLTGLIDILFSFYGYWQVSKSRHDRAVVAHRINAERLVLLGWSRAILLQMAHPLVAAGVKVVIYVRLDSANFTFPSLTVTPL